MSSRDIHRKVSLSGRTARNGIKAGRSPRTDRERAWVPAYHARRAGSRLPQASRTRDMILSPPRRTERTRDRPPSPSRRAERYRPRSPPWRTNGTSDRSLSPPRRTNRTRDGSPSLSRRADRYNPPSRTPSPGRRRYSTRSRSPVKYRPSRDS
jgi:hypothetical protein